MPCYTPLNTKKNTFNVQLYSSVCVNDILSLSLSISHTIYATNWICIVASDYICKIKFYTGDDICFRAIICAMSTTDDNMAGMAIYVVTGCYRGVISPSPPPLLP